MIDFANLASMTIPEGKVVQIACNGVVLWDGGGEVTPPSYTNMLPRAEAIDSDAPYNGIGYRVGYYLTSSGTFEAAGKSNEWVTGYIPYTVDKPIYIKGVSFTTASHDRMYFFSTKTVRVAPGVGGSTLGTYFTVEQLGTDYYKLTPISGSGLPATAQWVRMSFTTGNPADVVITIDEPIE